MQAHPDHSDEPTKSSGPPAWLYVVGTVVAVILVVVVLHLTGVVGG